MITAKSYYALAIAAGLATVLFLIFSSGALGIIGEGGRPDRIYLAVLAVAAIGTLAARLRPRGMALALAATAFAQVLVTAAALLAGLPEGASAIDIVGINAMFAGLFGFAAWLFWRSAERPAGPSVGERL